MTDQLLQRVEEKMMALLTELETLRNDLHHFKQENSQLKMDKAAYTKKLQALVAALDSFENSEPTREFELVRGEEPESAIA